MTDTALSLKEIMESVREKDGSDAYGRQMADQLRAAARTADSQSNSNLAWRAKAIGGMLDELTASGDDRECTQLLLEWVEEQFWGHRIREYIPTFESIYSQLDDLGARYDNRLIYGDMDYGAWVEPHSTLKIIGLECYCSGADNNTHLYILNPEPDGFSSFHVRTCYPRAHRNQYMKRYGGWAGLERASRSTYKTMGWLPQYGDGRDIGYILSYDEYAAKVERGGMSSHISHAMWTMETIQSGIDRPLDLPKVAE